jgi:hypothetical protein
VRPSGERDTLVSDAAGIDTLVARLSRVMTARFRDEPAMNIAG